MSPKRIYIKSNHCKFFAEPCPGDLGFRIVKENRNGNCEYEALIVDNQENFLCAGRYQSGMLIHIFIPTVETVMKNGSKAVIAETNSLEVFTHHKRHMFAIPLSEKESGIMIVYKGENGFISVAVLTEDNDELIVNLAD